MIKMSKDITLTKLHHVLSRGLILYLLLLLLLLRIKLSSILKLCVLQLNILIGLTITQVCLNFFTIS